MSFIYGLITGFILFSILYFIYLKASNAKHGSEKGFVNAADRKKDANLDKIISELPSLGENELTNEYVRALCKVSDTTACRYLDELEGTGLIVQKGTDGPKVYYTKS